MRSIGQRELTLRPRQRGKLFSIQNWMAISHLFSLYFLSARHARDENNNEEKENVNCCECVCARGTIKMTFCERNLSSRSRQRSA